MQKLLFFLSVCIAACCLAGCFSGKSEDPQVRLRSFTENDETPALKAATDYMDGFADALKANDFSLWQPVLAAQGATEITREKFDRMYVELHHSFGTFENASYLGYLVTGNLRSYLWKFRFSREENGKTVIRDVVFYTKIFCADGETPAVSGFGVKVF